MSYCIFLKSIKQMHHLSNILHLVLLISVNIIGFSSCSKNNDENEDISGNNGQGDSSSSITKVEAIDLGLSVMWASQNVGASSVEDKGTLIQWGYTKEKSFENDINDDMEYPEDICESEYDFARSEWGNNWRMPTKNEIRELYNCCEKEFISINGKFGLKFTGPNGNSIFLPATHDEYGYEYKEEATTGYYWSGSAWWPGRTFYGLQFAQDIAPHLGECYFYDEWKCAVRPVCGEEWTYKYEPYKYEPQLRVSKINEEKFFYDEEGRINIFGNIDYVPGYIKLPQGHKEGYHSYLIKSNKTGGWKNYYDLLTDYHWMRLEDGSMRTYIHFTLNEGYREYDTTCSFTLDSDGYLLSGRRSCDYLYKEGNLIEVKYGDDSGTNQGEWYTLKIEYSNEKNNASVDFNRYFSYITRIYDIMEKKHNHYYYTGNIYFDAFDFIGTRDKNLMSKITCTPGKYNYNQWGTAAYQNTFKYLKDTQGRISKVIITSNELYSNGSIKSTKTATYEITY